MRMIRSTILSQKLGQAQAKNYQKLSWKVLNGFVRHRKLNLDLTRKNKGKSHKLISNSTLGRSRCTKRRSRTQEEAVAIRERLLSFTALFKSVMERVIRVRT